MDVGVLFEEEDCCVGVIGLEGAKPCILYHIDSSKQDERVVFDDQYDRAR